MKPFVFTILAVLGGICCGEEAAPYAGLAAAPGTRGKLIVTEIAHRGPADKAGINTGDYILLINGKKLSTREELRALITATPPGQELTLTLQRKDYTITRTLKMGNRLTPQAVFRPSERHLGEEKIDAIIHQQHLIAAELTKETPDRGIMKECFARIRQLHPEPSYASLCYLFFYGSKSTLVLSGNEDTLTLTEVFHDKNKADESYRIFGRGAETCLPAPLRVRIRCHIESIPSFFHLSLD